MRWGGGTPRQPSSPTPKGDERHTADATSRSSGLESDPDAPSSRPASGGRPPDLGANSDPSDHSAGASCCSPSQIPGSRLTGRRPSPGVLGAQPQPGACPLRSLPQHRPLSGASGRQGPSAPSTGAPGQPRQGPPAPDTSAPTGGLGGGRRGAPRALPGRRRCSGTAFPGRPLLGAAAHGGRGRCRRRAGGGFEILPAHQHAR